jgi:hypothetical protein
MTAIGKATRIVVGLLLGVFAALLAFALAAGGDGWDTPFYPSLAQLVLLPMAFLIGSPLRGYDAARKRTLLRLLGAAFVIDVLMAAENMILEPDRLETALRMAPLTTAAWVAIWFGWQTVLLATVIRGEAKARAA